VITESEEKYIRYLYKVGAYKGNLISTTKVARALNITPPSAVEALKKLSWKGLVKYVERRGVCLTDEGYWLALKIIRIHRILETALVKASNLDVEIVCKSIEGLELRFNEEFIEALYESLGNPKCCPHGEEIPKVEGSKG